MKTTWGKVYEQVERFKSEKKNVTSEAHHSHKPTSTSFHQRRPTDDIFFAVAVHLCISIDLSVPKCMVTWSAVTFVQDE